MKASSTFTTAAANKRRYNAMAKDWWLVSFGIEMIRFAFMPSNKRRGFNLRTLLFPAVCTNMSVPVNGAGDGRFCFRVF